MTDQRIALMLKAFKITALVKFLFSFVLWSIIIFGVVLPSTPLWVAVIFIRKLEQWVNEQFYDMKRIETDAVLWMLDSPENKSNINGIMFTKESLSLKRLQRVVLDKFVEPRYENGDAKFPNATRCIKPGFLNYYWSEEDQFDIEDHVYVWTENVYLSMEEMAKELGKISSRPLIHENSLSPWEFVLLHFIENGIQKTCIMIRFHHAYADGISLVNFLVNRLSDDVSEQVSIRSVPKKYQLLMKCQGLFNAPLVLFKLILSCRPSHRLHSTGVSGAKELFWSKPISLDRIKSIKKKLKVTVNDILMGSLATRIQHYLSNENSETVPDSLKAYCPFNTRYSLSEADTLSNKFGNVFLSLPISSVHPVHNIMELNETMNELKYSGDYHGMRYIANLVNYALPLSLNKFVFDYLSTYSSMVISNVPGPQESITIDGTSIEMMSFWPPKWKNIGMSVSVLSYDGEVRIGLCCDSALKIKPRDLLNGLEDIFESVETSVGLD